MTIIVTFLHAPKEIAATADKVGKVHGGFLASWH